MWYLNIGCEVLQTSPQHYLPLQTRNYILYGTPFSDSLGQRAAESRLNSSGGEDAGSRALSPCCGLGLLTAQPVPLVVGEDALAQADVFGRDFYHLILGNEVQGLF